VIINPLAAIKEVVENSIDAKISKEVARKLNFPWHFVDYDKIDFNQKLIETREFVDYYNFAFNNVSVFLLQDFFAVKYLNNNNIIPKDSIIVPGHSGDFLVGNHLYPFDKNKISNKSVMKQILKRHYVLNAYLKDNEIEKKLIHQIPNEGLSYSKIDNFNLKERQSKFIVNANRVYEYFGYEHRLPLWDDDLVDFFRKLPFHYKINSILYFKVIIEKIFIPNDVYIIPPDKNKSRLIRTLKEYIPIPLAYCLRYLLHNNKMLNTNVGYFKVLKPMVSKYNIKSYQINGILSKWLIKELF
jgi:asparagine synthase (glutamine-hydrolysing)